MLCLFSVYQIFLLHNVFNPFCIACSLKHTFCLFNDSCDSYHKSFVDNNISVSLMLEIVLLFQVGIFKGVVLRFFYRNLLFVSQYCVFYSSTCFIRLPLVSFWQDNSTCKLLQAEMKISQSSSIYLKLGEIVSDVYTEMRVWYPHCA